MRKTINIYNGEKVGTSFPSPHFKIFSKGAFVGYRINKLLFRLFFFACIALLIITGIIDGFDLQNHYYVSCPEDSMMKCSNPLYGACDQLACRDEYLLPGVSYGVPPPFLLQNVGLFVIIIMGSFLILNHLLYNRKFRPSGDAL